MSRYRRAASSQVTDLSIARRIPFFVQLVPDLLSRGMGSIGVEQTQIQRQQVQTTPRLSFSGAIVPALICSPGSV